VLEFVGRVLKTFSRAQAHLKIVLLDRSPQCQELRLTVGIASDYCEFVFHGVVLGFMSKVVIHLMQAMIEGFRSANVPHQFNWRDLVQSAFMR